MILLLRIGIVGFLLSWVNASTSNPLNQTGMVCQRNITLYMTTYKVQSYIESQKYKTSCGVFGWSRCSKYRPVRLYRAVAVPKALTNSQDYCCDGWKRGLDGNCTIHNRVPLIAKCTNDVTAVGSAEYRPKATITWPIPTFTEPFDFDMKVIANVTSNTEDLRWGDFYVSYVATSMNNNLTTPCNMRIRVVPPPDNPKIKNHTNGGVIQFTPDVPLKLTCEAGYGDPHFRLNWFLNGTDARQYGAKVEYKETFSLFQNYWKSNSSILLLPRSDMNGLFLVCNGTKPGDVNATSVTHAILRTRDSSTINAAAEDTLLPFPTWYLGPIILGGMLLITLVIVGVYCCLAGKKNKGISEGPPKSSCHRCLAKFCRCCCMCVSDVQTYLYADNVEIMNTLQKGDGGSIRMDTQSNGSRHHVGHANGGYRTDTLARQGGGYRTDTLARQGGLEQLQNQTHNQMTELKILKRGEKLFGMVDSSNRPV